MSILGKLLGTDQAKEGIAQAGRLAQQGAEKSTALLNQGLLSQLAQYEPIQNMGQSALSRYASLLNGTYNINQDMANDQNYQAMLKQGINAIQNSAAGNGMLRSGAAQQALYNQGTSLANQYLQNKMSNLYNLAMQGQQANANVANLYGNNANQLANIQSNLYNTLGQNAIAKGNIDSQKAQAITSIAAGILTGGASAGLGSLFNTSNNINENLNLVPLQGNWK